MRRPGTTTLASIAMLVATSSAVAACGGGSTSAQSGPTSPATTQPAAGLDQACTAGRRLSSTLGTVVSDLQAGNVSAARGAVPQAESALSDLSAAVTQLQADESAKLRPQVDALKTQLQAAQSASSPAELRTSLTQAGAALGTLAATLRTDLQCPSP